MNASATMRRSYYRTMTNRRPSAQSRGMPVLRELESRPVRDDKLSSFKPVDHLAHREQCKEERDDISILSRTSDLDSFMDLDDMDAHVGSRVRLKKMCTVFPFRDPIYLVAIIFAVGSLDLLINGFFDFTTQITAQAMDIEAKENIASPTTLLIGSIFFFIAGILDTFGALNADRGTLETTKDLETKTTVFKPALIGSSAWNWFPPSEKVLDLFLHNLAFQAGLVVLVGGIIFMMAGVTDFPGVVPKDSSIFDLLVFGPQILHGAMFFVANTLLAISEQTCWWRPKLGDPDWQGAFLNATGGALFMVAGLFLAGKDEVAASVAGMVGSAAFLLGSLLRWYIVMEFY